ncbi:MAG: hypothetical protein EBU39_03355, partial [Proteobacteria bacterium]|nr:hypothetical protein [Pseudomonadota bacterium]
MDFGDGTNNGALTFAAAEALGAADRNLTVSTTGGVTLSGIISSTGAYGITKLGTGTLTLSGANTYTGLTTVSAGSLTYGVNDAIYTGAVTVNGSTAILALGIYTDSVGAVTLTAGSITGTGSSTQGILTSTSGFTLNPASGTVTVTANLAGAVNLTKSGAGTANLSGYNAYSGTTTLNTSGGILAITGSGSLSGTSAGVYSGAISIGSGATFIYSSSTNQTLQTGVISGAGSLTKDTDASSVLTLTGANTYTGNTTLTAGIIRIGNAGSGTVGSITNSSVGT